MKKCKVLISFIIVVAVLSCLPMFVCDFNIQYDDGIQHICRLIGTEQSIEEGQLIPMIMSKLCNNFGYSWNLFYSPTTAYLPLFFRIFSCSYELCLKLFIVLVTIATGFSMYFFIRKILQDKLEEKRVEVTAILAAVLYILVPYRLTDIYLRVAVAELTSFMFLPMVFNGLYTIVNQKQKSYILVIAASGMLLTHSLLTVYLAIFCVFYLLVNIKEIDKRTVLMLAKSILLILLITAFYWVPMLQSYLSTSYEVFNQDHMVRFDTMETLKPSIIELAFMLDGRMNYGIGIVTIVGVFLGIAIVIQNIIKKKKTDKNYILFIVCGLISVIMALDFFPFEKLPSLFTAMQFSFRMLEFGSFFLVTVAAIAISTNIQKFNIYTVICLTAFSVLLLLPYINRIPAGTYYSEEALEEGVAVTSSTGRVHAGCASFEYLPTKAFENRSYIENREDVPTVLNDSDVEISNYEKDGTNCNFEVSNILTETEIELPYIYYIGYTVQCENASGEKYVIDTYESENGFLCINASENCKISVSYKGTTAMKLAYIVSIATVVGAVVYYCFNNKFKK